MDAKRRQSLEKFMEVDQELDASTNGGCFDTFVRDKLFWAASCLLHGNISYDTDLADALGEDERATDELLPSAYWPIGSPWLDAALQYYKEKNGWLAWVRSCFVDETEECGEEVKLLTPEPDAGEQLKKLQDTDFLRGMPESLRRGLLELHLDEMRRYVGCGIFCDDETDDSCLVVLCSERLRKYLAVKGGMPDGRVGLLLSSLKDCFDEAFELYVENLAGVVGIVYTDGYHNLADVRPRLLIVGELLDEAIDEELRKTGEGSPEKGKAS